MSDDESAARMEITPEEIREDDEGYQVECPACGTSTTLMTIVESGHCGGVERGEVDCTAELSLELVWSE